MSLLEDFVAEVTTLKAELEDERKLRHQAEDAWRAMCELLGERLTVEVDVMHFTRQVTAKVEIDEAAVARESPGRLAELERHLAHTLAHGIFLAMQKGEYGRRLPQLVRYIPVPDAPGGGTREGVTPE